MFVPTKAFLTKGVGRHKEKLTSFEMALRDAHLANFNLVRVSSIFPPHCELVDREEGLSLMKPGQVVFAVIAESATNEPSRLVAASIGVAMPADQSHHGYISEHHSYGQNEMASGEDAEDLAASMLATRSEEHTSELQSQSNLVCRLLLEKKKTKNSDPDNHPRA